jgi:hypothetical protein
MASHSSQAAQPRKLPPLTETQLYVLRMTTPEWPTAKPDARARRVLESLRARGLVYQNFERWYINAEGRAAVEAAGG